MRITGTARLIYCLQCLFRPGADGDVLGQIDPADRPRGVDVKLRRARNVVTFRPGAAMKNIVTPNDCGIRVGQKRECVVHFPAMGCSDVTRINANRGEMDSSFIEIRQTLLKTPQLGVTEWSPISTIEDHHRAIGRK